MITIKNQLTTSLQKEIDYLDDLMEGVSDNVSMGKAIKACLRFMKVLKKVRINRFERAYHERVDVHKTLVEYFRDPYRPIEIHQKRKVREPRVMVLQDLTPSMWPYRHWCGTIVCSLYRVIPDMLVHGFCHTIKTLGSAPASPPRYVSLFPSECPQPALDMSHAEHLLSEMKKRACYPGKMYLIILSTRLLNSSSANRGRANVENLAPLLQNFKRTYILDPDVQIEDRRDKDGVLMAGEDESGCFRITCRGMEYFFEQEPQFIDKRKNSFGYAWNHLQTGTKFNLTPLDIQRIKNSSPHGSTYPILTRQKAPTLYELEKDTQKAEHLRFTTLRSQRATQFLDDITQRIATEE